jgi:hypothetical protein
MQRLDGDDFDFLHSWIWDRTRAVSKDLRTQRIESRSDIKILLTCLERSARFLILSAHQMARSEKEDYVHQQDVEQLNQTMTSLNERYADNRRVNYPSENEAEFFAYRLILAPLFSNTQHEDILQGLPVHLRKNARVKTAIVIYRAINAVILNKSASFNAAQANWKKLWDLIKSPRVSYLMACTAEFAFQRVRHTILDTLWRVYRYGNQSRPQTIESWTVGKLRETMAFDTDAETVEFCEMYNFQFNSIDGGPTFLDVTAHGFAKEPLSVVKNKDQIFSQGIVEVKRKDRLFSAVIQAMSIEEAQRRGLMSDSSNEVTNGEASNGEMEDETSLFVPEARPAQSNAFTQPKASISNPTTNPFLPKTTVDAGAGAPKTNPFLPNQPSTSAPSAAKPNPFLPKPSPLAQGSAGPVTGAVQPGLFDPSKNPIKFAPAGAASASSARASKPNPFLAVTSSGPATPKTNAANGVTTPSFQFCTPAAHVNPPPTTATPPIANTSTVVFPGLHEAALKASSATPSFSFTPAGSPAPAAPSTQGLEKQQAEDDARRRQQAAEVEAQRQREQQEQARRAQQQRIEAEQQRQRLQEEERNRQVREAQEAKMRQEEARLGRERARDNAYKALAEDIMFDVNEGLMMQFVENLIVTSANQAIADQRAKKLEKVREKQEAMADAMAHQRLLGLQRMAMIKLLARTERRKRDQKARDRRKRLREQKAKAANMEEGASNLPTPVASELQADWLDNGATFRKPQVPASARRARRTEQRRGTLSSQQDGDLDLAAPMQQSATQAVLTPISMNISQSSNRSYSEAYRKSTAPIDRTESDWFALRAEGYDPSMLRKRNFEAAADEDQSDIEPKRSKMSPSITEQPPVPQTTTTLDRRARLDVISQQFRKSAGSPQTASGSTSFNGRSSLGKSTSMLIEQARQVLSRSKASTSNVQHDYGRSVPNLHRRTMSAQPSVLGRSMGAPMARAAYWDRPSRFVPKECYGQGANAVRDYRIKYGLSSPANTRPNSTEPPAALSPIPTQTSYPPVNGYTQEQYSGEESSGIEVVDVDAEDENPGTTDEEENADTTEEEYEGDEESDENQHLNRRQSHSKIYSQNGYDEDGDSSMHDDQIEYADDDGYVNGQYADEALVDHDGYTDSDAESKEDSETQFAQRAHLAQKKPAAIGGNCEEDAIELSD